MTPSERRLRRAARTVIYYYKTVDDKCAECWSAMPEGKHDETCPIASLVEALQPKRPRKRRRTAK